MANVELVPPEGLQLTQARLIPHNDRYWISGTFFKKNPQQASGIFVYQMEQGKVVGQKFQNFKDMNQFNDYAFWTGNEAAPTMESKKTQGHIIIDGVVPHDQGITIAMEVLEKSYQTKGALQQEIETNQLVANLDQDQFGRRSMGISADDTQTAEDRISMRSATDILQYRYRNALVSQPTFQGMAFDRSLLITFDNQLNTTHFKAVKTGKPDLLYLGAPNAFQSGADLRLFYDRGGEVYAWNYDPLQGALDNFVRREYASGKSSRVFRLSSNEFMIVELEKVAAGFILKLEKNPF